MIPILVLKTENKVIYNQSNLNCKTFFEEFIWTRSLANEYYTKNVFIWVKQARKKLFENGGADFAQGPPPASKVAQARKHASKSKAKQSKKTNKKTRIQKGVRSHLTHPPPPLRTGMGQDIWKEGKIFKVIIVLF